MALRRPLLCVLIGVLVGVLFGVAAPANAQVRFLGWGDTGPGNVELSPDCDALAPFSTLVASFVAPESCTQVARLQAELDFCTAPDALPEWWRFDLPEGCRFEAASLSAFFGNGPFTWTDPWEGAGSVNTELEFFPEWNDNETLMHARITVTPQTPVTLVAGTHYYAFRLVFDQSGGRCDGCAGPACFVVNSLSVFGPDDESGCWTTQDGRNHAMWQGGTDGCPFIVPVLPSTWGGIKRLYRGE